MPANSRWDLIRGLKGYLLEIWFPHSTFRKARLLADSPSRYAYCYHSSKPLFRKQFDDSKMQGRKIVQTFQQTHSRCFSLICSTISQNKPCFQRCRHNYRAYVTHYLKVSVIIFRRTTQVCLTLFNPLRTKRRPLYLKTQFVPRCKHFSSWL